MQNKACAKIYSWVSSKYIAHNHMKEIKKDIKC